MLQPTIPNYEIKEKISKGSMATVYRAIHTPLHREVALKVLSFEKNSFDKSAQKRFLAEALISANLEHPNIINIYDTGRHQDFCYFSMEYLKQGSLKLKLSGNRAFSTNESLEITRQIATALSYTHSRGYIHRDIKPENILFKSQDHIVLTDFGIAKRKNTTQNLTQNRILPGSLQYIAPEQALDQNADNRSDIYSLGAILYELLTGKATYNSNHSYTTNLSNLQNSLSYIDNNLKKFTPILRKSLAKDPEDRFQNIEDFLIAIKSINPEPEKYPSSKDIPTNITLYKNQPTNNTLRPINFITITSLIILVLTPTYLSRGNFIVKPGEVVIAPTTIKQLVTELPDDQAIGSEHQENKPLPPSPLSSNLTIDQALVEPELVEPELVEPELVEPELVEPELVEPPYTTDVTRSVPTIPSISVPLPPGLKKSGKEPDINCILKLKSCEDKSLLESVTEKPDKPITEPESRDEKEGNDYQQADMACILNLSECSSQDEITIPTKD